MPAIGPYSRPTALAKLDGRTREARLMRRVRAELVAHVGGQPSATQRALIDRAVWLSLHVAQLDARAAEGRALLGVVAVGEIAVIQGEAERSGKPLSIPEAIREWLRQKGVQFQSDPQSPNAAGQPSSGQDPRGLRNNNPLNLSFSPEQRGLDPNAPHDGRFGRYVSMEAGIASAARQLLRYQERYGLNNVAGIISRWAPPGENDTAAYIDRVSKALGIRPGDPLDLRNPSTMATLVGAMARVEVGRPLMSDVVNRGVGMALGQQPAGGNPTFAQTTNITVQGASDPAGTARLIGREQDRVNADIIRNLQGAMR